MTGKAKLIEDNPDIFADKTKEAYKLEKLRLEIAELKKAWWKKPTCIAALFPSVLALVTLVYGFANGYFQASFTKLENPQKENRAEHQPGERKAFHISKFLSRKGAFMRRFTDNK